MKSILRLFRNIIIYCLFVFFVGFYVIHQIPAWYNIMLIIGFGTWGIVWIIQGFQGLQEEKKQKAQNRLNRLKQHENNNS